MQIRVSVFIQKLDDELVSVFHLKDKEEAVKLIEILQNAFWFEPVKFNLCDHKGRLLEVYASQVS